MQLSWGWKAEVPSLSHTGPACRSRGDYWSRAGKLQACKNWIQLSCSPASLPRRKVSLQQDLKGWSVTGLGVLGIWLGEPLNILTFWCVCCHPHTALGLQGHEAMSGFFTCVLGL